MKHFFLILLICLGLFPLGSIEAKVKLPSIFTTNMVLQQQSDVPFWGEATPNKKVKITTSWNGKVYETVATSTGKWETKVSTPVFGGPYTIDISDGSKIKLENVLIGEVWVCSGQSNMEMPLAGWGKVMNFEQEISAANYPNVRLLQVVKNTSTKPLNDLNPAMGGWVPCSPQTVREFSSVAYFFGKNLYDNKNIPIGLINTSWGGTIAEAWTSGNSLKTMPDFTAPVLTMEKNSSDVNVDPKAKYDHDLTIWKNEVEKADKGKLNGQAVWAKMNLDETDWKTMNIPDVWENQGLPGFDGVVWFRKTVDIPTDWQNKDLKLNLDMIDDNDVTYFNGVEVGHTEGYNLSRTYNIPANLVTAGKAVITVRVHDLGGGGGIYGNAALLKLSLSTDKFIALAGGWKYKTGFSMSDIPAAPKSWNEPNRPTVLFNAMINPIIPFTIKGAIWYQGESNADRAYQYRELFPLMIKDWRKHWNLNFPFYFVQLANYTKVLDEPAPSDWAELREAQLKTLNLENTGMAVTIDIGDAKDIHPKNKQEVGRRLSLIARANAYGEAISFSGPIYDTYRIEGNTIRIKFKYVEGGLKIRNGEKLTGFEIAGLDHKFKWADATIVGNDVIVSCPAVENPIAVRYAWAENPVCNLFNSADLPASPFRTDDWKGVTCK
ncbi:MAG: sialate O-acetylesterase [Bacteroidota bacterium]|nr:sialate O-acetylesterase [Bacteroidota bacterium]